MFLDSRLGADWAKARGLEQEWLPHLFVPHYKWSLEFCTTTQRCALICAANQVGKSSAAIRKNFFLATEPELWKTYFPARGHRVNLFWYYYPNYETLNEEFETKWREWLPSVPSSHPLHSRYGWKLWKKTDGKLGGVTFNTGVRISFKFYSQLPRRVQSSTVDMMTGDEEIPDEHRGEMQARLTATGGILNSVFTATLGQYYWFCAMEKRGSPDEALKKAWKQSISLYDCLEYSDGSKGTPWTLGRIDEVIDTYSDELEIQKRVFGKFVHTAGRAFYAYQRPKVEIPKYQVVRGRPVFAAVDPGSGGVTGHPAAILIVDQDLERNLLTVLSCWRGDGIATTSNDILKQFQKMALGLEVSAVIYDGAAADFYLTLTREVKGVQVVPADKKRVNGIERVNSYLEAGAIQVPKTRPEGLGWWSEVDMERLHEELRTVINTEGNKKKGGMIDDLTDCLRYACMRLDLNLNLVQRIGKKGFGSKKTLRRHGRHVYYEEELRNAGKMEQELEIWRQIQDEGVG